MAINKKVSNEIGLYDEVFGRGYGEENDWCMKAYKKGYKNVIITNLFVFHKHVASFTPDEKKALLKKNRRLVSKRHPEYDKMVQEFIRRDELQPLRDIL